MNVNLSQYPKVFIYNEDLSSEDYIALEAVLAKKQSFVMIRYRKEQDSNHEAKRDNAAHKHHAKWFKNNREEIARWCVGGIIIVPNYLLAKATEAVSGSMEKAFKFPIKVLRDEKDIDTWVETFLQR